MVLIMKKESKKVDRTRPEITVKPKDEFFIVIGKSGQHSFIALGVMQDNAPLLLARIGKTNNLSSNIDSNLKMGFKNIFYHTIAKLKGESLTFHGDISYAAYTINIEQYNQFLKLVGKIKKPEDPFFCYQVSKELASGTLKFKYEPVITTDVELDAKIAAIAGRTTYINELNTCRHTAIDLLQYTLGTDKISDKISRQYFMDLPCKSSFKSGISNENFYVFPLPPSMYPDKNPIQAKMLTKIFLRMEELIKKDPYGEETVDKFNALKKLYNEQAGLPNGDITQALVAIKNWKESNKDVISTLRSQSFFGKLFTKQSSTLSLTEDLINELEQTKNSPQ